MERQVVKKFKAWKKSSRRKPLVVMGARQVGKTTSLKKFGASEYLNYVHVNFENNDELKGLFEKNLDPKRIIKALSIELDANIVPEKTLLIFDEIQECPNALNSLKYFNEKANEYHICAAGSLLGVKLARTKGFPVGKVNFAHMFPLNYMEFLEALGQTRLKEFLETIDPTESIPSPLHEKCLDYLKIYMYTGGMPEAVAMYRDTEDFLQTREVHHEILRTYALDFSKHAPPNIIMKISECWRSIISQLAKENKKFIYSVVRQGARARGYEDAIQWLVEAGLFYKIYNVHTPKIPISAYENRDIFKTYLVDVGLLNTMANLPLKVILHNHELFQEFRGSLTENFIAQELSQQHEQLYYWTSENRAEIDFILQYEENIYPLDVKSGHSKHKKSLLTYSKKYHPSKLLRTSPMNLIQNGDVFNCPLYLISQLSRLIDHTA